MKIVPVESAVGMVLCHDITRIVPGEFKGRAFKKGHVVTEADIPVLLDLGKAHVYVYDPQEGFVHENDAARRIAVAAAGAGLSFSDPVEGKVDLTASGRGLLKVDVEGLLRVNAIEDIVFATLHTNQAVSPGRKVAGTRIVPLVTDEEKVAAVEAVCARFHPIIEIRPFSARRVGIVTTGSEVYHGRIEDGFGPVVRDKFEALGCTVMRQILVSDDIDMTVAAIGELLDAGAEMIAVTGGMSVDPDDQTPSSIRAAGGQVVTYGAPVLPGAMFLLAHIGSVPVVGLPGCVMYHRTSIFDLVVPRILAGDPLTRVDITTLGHGGLCEACETCRYPVCGFGKGS